MNITESLHGTKEWSDFSYNIGIGCSHNCVYCYARIDAVDRFGRVENWEKERLKKGGKHPHIPANVHKVMFPTTHDISPFYLEASIEALKHILDSGKDVLIVSKPHLECIKRICTEFPSYKERIEFRFTIGTLEEPLAKFWEPGAPTIAERLQSVDYALGNGFKVSISMEPMLADTKDAIKTFRYFAEKEGINEIWIGTQNPGKKGFYRNRTPEISKACAQIALDQSPSEILKMVRELHGHPKLHWKDTIKKIIRNAGLPL